MGEREPLAQALLEGEMVCVVVQDSVGVMLSDCVTEAVRQAVTEELTLRVPDREALPDTEGVALGEEVVLRHSVGVPDMLTHALLVRDTVGEVVVDAQPENDVVALGVLVVDTDVLVESVSATAKPGSAASASRAAEGGCRPGCKVHRESTSKGVRGAPRYPASSSSAARSTRSCGTLAAAAEVPIGGQGWRMGEKKKCNAETKLAWCSAHKKGLIPHLGKAYGLPGGRHVSSAGRARAHARARAVKLMSARARRTRAATARSFEAYTSPCRSSC